MARPLYSRARRVSKPPVYPLPRPAGKPARAGWRRAKNADRVRSSATLPPENAGFATLPDRASFRASCPPR
jgi:hypothetical protein